MSKSSSLLYSLTKKRAYFQEVTIIVPAAWSDQPEYKKVPDADYFPTANVQIGPPHPSYQNTPYTSQPGGCGEFGRYIHITPEYILNYPDDGLAKVFVHEWFHLRYGVFDEYGIPDNDQFPMFYMSKGSFVSSGKSRGVYSILSYSYLRYFLRDYHLTNFSDVCQLLSIVS